MPLLIALGVLVVIALIVIMLYNRLVAIRNQTSNAWKQIDVQLKRRHDLIPNLVEVVKDYMSYEQETLRQVIEARNQAVKAPTPVRQGRGPRSQAARAPTPRPAMQAGTAPAGARGKLFAGREASPALKANKNVAPRREERGGTEKKFSSARQFYNDSVMSL